ncbi:MAG: large subunit ribosomal protein L31 [Chloroflexi bacterium]|nr:MAG: large subunit ribosomal protein L31 [Chloroflexota bacterium]MBA4374557.1 50S ribosomal protein L31 [Anaerolinea sp.]
MRKGIHPTYYPDAKVVCSCGNTWATGSTKKEIRTEVCSKCHPFFTGQQQRMIDIEGQVDRFYKKLQARQEFVDEKKARETSRVSPERSVREIGLPTRSTEALEKAGLDNIGKLLAKLAEGEAGMLAIEGFGRKSLIDMKKTLRQLGYDLPAAAEEIVV